MEIGNQARPGTTLQPGIPPPPDYYRNNLLRVLEHVWNNHRDLLAEQESRFTVNVRAASREAQRLYARLITRKGPQIRADKLEYREVGDLSGAVDELVQSGLVERNADAPADSLLNLFTRKELAALFDSRTATKRALLQDILQRHSDAAIRERLRLETNWLCVSGRQSLDLVQLLYFGGSAVGARRGDLTTFVLEDLGTARFESYAVSRGRRLFSDRAELGRYLVLRGLNDLSHRLDEHPGVAGAVLAAIARLPEAATRLERRLRDRTLNRLGRWFERRGCDDAALDCYTGSSLHPARERRVRILNRLGDAAAVRTLLDEMAGEPKGPEEQDFAARFGRRRTACPPPVTVAPFESGKAESIENLALDRLRATGGEGWHLENRLPLGLAGLAFWEIVFAAHDGVFLNPYQAGPIDLFWEDFPVQRQAELTRTKAALNDPRRFGRALRGTFEDKFGTVNHLVSWRHLDRYLLDRILETVPHGVLFPLVCHVIENLWRTRTGFPDLLVLYGTGDYEFVEVKGPTDQLQPAQRTWFNYFRANGCNARVLKFKAADTGPSP